MSGITLAVAFAAWIFVTLFFMVMILAWLHELRSRKARAYHGAGRVSAAFGLLLFAFTAPRDFPPSIQTAFVALTWLGAVLFIAALVAYYADPRNSIRRSR